MINILVQILNSHYSSSICATSRKETIMRRVAAKFLLGLMILQVQVLGYHQNPMQTNGNSNSIDEDKVKYTIISLENKTVPATSHEIATDLKRDSYRMDRAEALQKLRDQILQAKRSQYRIFAHDPEDILFILTALILVCFHLFFMDMFVRMTRARFQTNTRYQYLSTVHLFLSFLVCAVYFLLILLHYRDIQYCG